MDRGEKKRAGIVGDPLDILRQAEPNNWSANQRSSMVSIAEVSDGRAVQGLGDAIQKR
jgi:hypothetical protein